jgi:PiT family inorganic phosphate transporter
MFSITLIAIVVFLALVFDFINGFHDTANAIATSVSTKALAPRTAIMIAASLNFVGALSGTAVATTIGKNIVAPDLVTPTVIIAALIGAIFWNLFTWYYGIPSSSSHALIGGLAGAVIAGFGFHAVLWHGFLTILIGLILAPIIGGIVGIRMQVGGGKTSYPVTGCTKQGGNQVGNRPFAIGTSHMHHFQILFRVSHQLQ